VAVADSIGPGVAAEADPERSNRPAEDRTAAEAAGRTLEDRPGPGGSDQGIGVLSCCSNFGRPWRSCMWMSRENASEEREEERERENGVRKG